MANVITNLSWGYYVTTPSIGAISTNILRIKAINYHPGASGDFVDIQDNNGNDVVKFLGTTHSSDAIDLWECQFDGLKISSCNGTLSTISILIA